MKNKGFTLIELLAVIVILAIIALIATPMILGVIDTAKQGSAKSAALGYIDAVEKTVMLSQFKEEVISFKENHPYDVVEGKIDGKTIDFKGDAPNGTIEFNADGSIKSAKLKFAKIYDQYYVYPGGTYTAELAS